MRTALSIKSICIDTSLPFHLKAETNPVSNALFSEYGTGNQVKQKIIISGNLNVPTEHAQVFLER
jgi:hypothetical protein